MTDVDKTRSIKYFLNGTLTSNIIIDTSAEATDTIDYVATDSAGNTATSTRTVIVAAPLQNWRPQPLPFGAGARGIKRRSGNV